MTIFFSRKSEQQRICLPSLLLLLSSQEGRESERSLLGGICTSVSTARTLDKNEWVFTPRYISLVNCATGKLWLNCDPSFCGSEWIKTALGKWQSMVQYPSPLPFSICLSDGNFHLNMCRNTTSSSKNWTNACKHHTATTILTFALCKRFQASCILFTAHCAIPV